MTSHVLNLEASQALSKLGINVPSEFWWIGWGAGTKWEVQFTSYTYGVPVEFIPAHLLSELYLVLQQLGEKKGWDEGLESLNLMAYQYYQDFQELCSLCAQDNGRVDGLVSQRVLELSKS